MPRHAPLDIRFGILARSMVRNSLLAVVFVSATAIAGEVLELEVRHKTEVVPFEPVLLVVRIRNDTNQFVRIHREFEDSITIERRIAPNGDWEQVEPSPSDLITQPPVLRVPGNLDFPPQSSFTLDRWLFWQSPIDNDGRAFLFDRAATYQMRVSLTVTLLAQPEVALKLTSNSSTIIVREPSKADSNAARFITNPWVVPMVSAGMPEKTSDEAEYFAIIRDRWPTSAVADFCDYMAGLNCLQRLDSKGSTDPTLSVRGRIIKAHAHLQSISQGSPLLRGRLAAQLLKAHRNSSEARAVLPLGWISNSLAAEAALPTNMFSMNGEQSYARYLHEQELQEIRDPRLDVKYKTNVQVDDTTESLVKRVAALSGVALDLSKLPHELRERRPTTLVRGDTQTLRAFLDAQRLGLTDWYWIAIDDGYALVHKAPTFSGKSGAHD